tara:strand:+ start:224 stop:838 length:615 start_codon:yes stop_codon:yes gene_type:complete
MRILRKIGLGILFAWTGFWLFILSSVAWVESNHEQQVIVYVFFGLPTTLVGWWIWKKTSKRYDDAIGYNAKNVSLTKDDLENNFARFSWDEMEHLVGRLFEEKGYSVKVTQKVADFGIDVEARNETEFIGIQVKHWEHNVGFEDTAKTLGVSQEFNRVIIVSSKAGFTKQAVIHEEQNSYKMELWDSQKFKDEIYEHMLKKSPK